ncbi:hypothetical protein DSO57_1014251 [Entomophthora muscae]|uniref:Uncharacterized protein n=2 Tax=Entomophthora muscae TaxID=34485 RepID=A0ACC2UF88_9FUNG|nr:hypothetical protein DSO57_1029639 [Entomophthora muscae]KAJ9085422.1 hypothetical protein DSO57_1014251 [Entomophthora muscae]
MKLIHLFASATLSYDLSICQLDIPPHILVQGDLNCFAKPPIEIRPTKPASAVYFYDQNIRQCRRRLIHHSSRPCIPFSTLEECIDACVEKSSPHYNEDWSWIRF